MPLLIPNFHVALIHFPIALLAIGVMLEVVCAIAWRDSSARVAARWMILFAALLGWPTLYSGAYAARTVAGDDFSSMSWADMRAQSPQLSDAATWETLRTHIVVNASVVAATSLVVVGWLMAGERLRRRIYAPSVGVLLLACAATTVGAWHGGELVYWHDATHITASANANSGKLRDVSFAPSSVLPPLDTHVLIAGFATGLALIAWGVAARSRRAVVPIDPATGAPALPGTSGPQANSPLVDPQRDRIFAAFQSATVEVVAPPPSSVLGTLAAFAFVGAAAFGLWSLATSYESWSPAVLFRAIIDADNKAGGVSRRLAHLIAGLMIICLSAVVGTVGARSRSSRAWPMVVGFVLFAALIVQAWLGVLLLLDSNSGSIVRFN